MKKAWKITRGVVVGLLLTVYVAVAVANYSVVQSYLGTAAGRYFSKEWGGTVKIGALHAMPWDHLILNDVLLVAPDGDTILDVKRAAAHFRKFPYSDMHLTIDRVSLRDGYYHLSVQPSDTGVRGITNLQYIIDYYLQGKERPPLTDVFTVDVGTLTAIHLRYKMDLAELPDWEYSHGVQIAHMDFHDVMCRAKNIHVENDDVSVRLVRFRCEERSGFKVDHVEGKVHVSPTDITTTDVVIRTPQSEVLADVRMTYDGWEQMMDYVNSVHHDITLKEGTSVALGDAAYWAPMLWGADTRIEVQGHLEGIINDMTTDLMVHLGERSGLLAAGSLRDITNSDSTVVDVDIERLWTSVDDLEPLLALLHTEEATRELLRQVDYVDFGGRVKGGMQTASTVNLTLSSGIGNLHLDAALTPRATGGLTFDMEAGSGGMGLNLLQSDWLTHTAFEVSAVGIWSDPKDIGTLRATVDGHLLNSVVQGRRLAPIDLSGSLERGAGHVKVQSDDSLAQLTMVADFDLMDTVKSLACDLAIAQLNTETFKLMPEKYGRLKTHAVLIAEGRDLDTMSGELTLEGTELGAVRVSKAMFTVEASEGSKTLQLASDPLDATVAGHFAYSDLALMARQIVNDLLPQELTHADSLTAEEEAALRGSDIQMQLLWKDRGDLLRSIDERLTVAYGTRLTASYTANERLKAVLHSNRMGMGTTILDNIGLSGRREGGAYRLLLEAQEVNIGTMELLQRANLLLTTNPSQTRMELLWGSEGSATRGDVELQLADRHVSVLKPDFTVGSTVWHLAIDSLALVTATGGGLGLAGSGVAVRSDRQSATARLSMQGRRDDCVELNFDNFSLTGLSDIFLQKSPLSIGGDIGGRFTVYGLNDIPYFNANLTIDSCEVNHQPLGEVELHSNWNAELNILNLILASDQLAADGWMQLGKEDADINFTADFNRFNLGLAAPLLSDFTSRFEGQLHGSFDITGTLTQPIVVGEALVEDGILQVDLTGVTYFFNDSIEFTNHLITLRDFRITDPQGNTAYVNGGIQYEDINDIELDLQLSTDRLLVLDRQQGDEFYGTLLASAAGTVTGSIDALDISVSARTAPGCKLTVPVNDQRQVQSQNYISFVSDKPEPKQTEGEKNKGYKMTLNLDLGITPDVQLNLPMDFSEVKVGVGASGSGDLHLSMSGDGEPQVVGSYEIVSGTMKLGLLTLIEKSFSIESGSRLDFRGALPDAQFDLRAVYSQRVNMSTLTGSLSEVGGTQKYIQVEDVIAIAGTLQEPTIGFDLRLPGADASVEEEVFAYIDRNSERDMMNQTVALLVTGSFYNANSASASGNLATSGGIGALSSLLTDMVSVVDIDVDYKMGNELTKDQLDVNISKDWGRWYLESTLGYGGESRELQTGEATSAVIDALVGYRLSPLVHLYAYNRTNTNDYTRMDLPYKQGVGLKLTKDFNKWTDLLKRKNER